MFFSALLCLHVLFLLFACLGFAFAGFWVLFFFWRKDFTAGLRLAQDLESYFSLLHAGIRSAPLRGGFLGFVGLDGLNQ